MQNQCILQIANTFKLQGIETLRKSLSQNLRRLRGKLTQAELAEAAEMPLRTYAEIELGNSWPQYRSIQALAEALNVHESELFMTVRDPSPIEALEIIKNALIQAEKPSGIPEPIADNFDVHRLLEALAKRQDMIEVALATVGLKPTDRPEKMQKKTPS